MYRSIKSHWIWSDPVKLKWWLTILFEVNHSDSKVALGYTVVEVKRGQSSKSLRTWANDFGTTVKAVTKFFEMLEKDGMIKRQTVGKGKHSTTMLTVCKYDTYQNKETQRGTQGYTQGYTEGEHNSTHKGGTNNNGNNANNVNNENKGFANQYFKNDKLNEVFCRWLNMLHERGKPMTQSSIEQLQMKMNYQQDDVSIKQIEQSLENGWLTLRPVESTDQPKPEPKKYRMPL